MEGGENKMLIVTMSLSVLRESIFAWISGNCELSSALHSSKVKGKWEREIHVTVAVAAIDIVPAISPLTWFRNLALDFDLKSAPWCLLLTAPSITAPPLRRRGGLAIGADFLFWLTCCR